LAGLATDWGLSVNLEPRLLALQHCIDQHLASQILIDGKLRAYEMDYSGNNHSDLESLENVAAAS